MKTVVVDRNRLAAALRRAMPLVPNVNTSPAVTAVLIKTGPDGLTATVTDTATWLNAQIDDEPRPTWAGCIAAGRLNDLVRSLPAGSTIGFEAGDQAVKLRSGGVTARLSVLPAADFPTIRTPVADKAVTFTLDGATLATALRFVEPSVGDDDSRRYLQGVYLDPAGVLVTVDGHRAATHRFATEPLPAFDGVTLPIAALRLLPSLLLKGFADAVTMIVSPGTVAVAAAGWTLTTKLVGGTFPEWRQILPPRSARPVVIDRAALVAAAERVKLMCYAKTTHGIRLHVETDQLTVCGTSVEATIEEVIPLASAASATTVGLNVLYLNQALAVIDAHWVELHAENERQPVWLCGAGEQEDGVLIMSMRV